MAIAQVVLGFERNNLTIIAGDPILAAFSHDIVVGYPAQLLRQQRGKLARRAFLDDDGLAVGHITRDVLVIADDLARQAVERFKLLVFAARIGDMRNARRLHLAAMLVNER